MNADDIYSLLKQPQRRTSIPIYLRHLPARVPRIVREGAPSIPAVRLWLERDAARSPLPNVVSRWR